MLKIIPNLIRWSARGAALWVVSLFLFLLLEEFINPYAVPPAVSRDWAGIGLLGCAIGGMLLAWKWELPGALASLAALAILVPVVRVDRYEIVLMSASPGLLYVVDWLVRRKQHNGTT